MYSEMESVQNTSDEIMSRKLASLLYGTSGYISFVFFTIAFSSYLIFLKIVPSPHSSYFGGDIANLRELSIESIRQFHKEFYRPDNTCMIVGGKWEGGDAALLESIRQYEDKILENWQLTPYNRPWSKCEGIDTDHIDNSKPVRLFRWSYVMLVTISSK